MWKMYRNYQLIMGSILFFFFNLQKYRLLYYIEVHNWNELVVQHINHNNLLGFLFFSIQRAFN